MRLKISDIIFEEPKKQTKEQEANFEKIRSSYRELNQLLVNFGPKGDGLQVAQELLRESLLQVDLMHRCNIGRLTMQVLADVFADFEKSGKRVKRVIINYIAYADLFKSCSKDVFDPNTQILHLAKGFQGHIWKAEGFQGHIWKAEVWVRKSMPNGFLVLEDLEASQDPPLDWEPKESDLIRF